MSDTRKRDPRQADNQASTPARTAEQQGPLAFVISVGLLLGALTLQWSNMTQDQQRAAEDRLFDGQTCKDSYPPPWRTRDVGLSSDLMPNLQTFGVKGCTSMEFRPSICNDEHFLVRCYAEPERKGLYKVYRIELESGEVFSMYPDMT